jgi:hypothetical protein
MTDLAGYLEELTVDDSDKSFVVPPKRAYEVISGTGRITTTATVGNRTNRLELLDPAGNLILGVSGSASVAASQTDAAFGDISAAAASDITVVPVLVPPGGSIRYYDDAAIDAAADDLEVRIMVRVYHA